MLDRSETPQDLVEAPEEKPAMATDWPSREQMERVQEAAIDGKSVKIERRESDDMTIQVGYDGPKFTYNSDGEDITEEVQRPKAARGIAIPIDLLTLALGPERVEGVVDEQRGSSRDYGVGYELGEEFLAVVRELLEKGGDR